jgi:hypothetical protein
MMPRTGKACTRFAVAGYLIFVARIVALWRLYALPRPQETRLSAIAHRLHEYA